MHAIMTRKSFCRIAFLSQIIRSLEGNRTLRRGCELRYAAACEISSCVGKQPFSWVPYPAEKRGRNGNMPKRKLDKMLTHLFSADGWIVRPFAICISRYFEKTKSENDTCTQSIHQLRMVTIWNWLTINSWTNWTMGKIQLVDSWLCYFLNTSS